MCGGRADRLKSRLCKGSKFPDRSIDSHLKGRLTYANKAQIEEAFENLFNNSRNAVEKLREILKEQCIPYEGKISVELFQEGVVFTSIKIRDNGIGMNPECIDAAYRRKYTTNKVDPENHGDGCLIIADCLEKNNAKIKVNRDETSHRIGAGRGTSQTIRFVKFIKGKENGDPL